jgi:hypothetical protein
MTPVEAMHMIEGHRFAALTNLASNGKTFLRIATQQAEVEALSRAMTGDPAVISEIFDRAVALAAMPDDGDREHEGDAALAIYLWLLSKHQQELAQTAASVRERRHFFWARKVADELHAAKGIANGETTREATQDIEALHREP